MIWIGITIGVLAAGITVFFVLRALLKELDRGLNLDDDWTEMDE